jgi:hypothetical protein
MNWIACLMWFMLVSQSQRKRQTYQPHLIQRQPIDVQSRCSA